jgi:phosphinothricin acetyltransferase
MLAIYAPIVTETAISFETDPPTIEEFTQRILDKSKTYPWLVCEAGGELLGYAYAGAYRSRRAYQWAVEVSVYVGSQNRRLGVGKALYTSLLNILELQGYLIAYAIIAVPNPVSTALHKSVGFEPFAVFDRVGFKFGKWHDVEWWRLYLTEQPPREPAPPADMSAVTQNPEWTRALTTGFAFFDTMDKE